MNRELRDKWVNELRHGGHDQASHLLKDTHRDMSEPAYCCLGVLGCVVMGLSPEEIRDGSVELLNSSILGEVGLSAADQNTLAKMNDDGFSFEDIADKIEELDV